MDKILVYRYGLDPKDYRNMSVTKLRFKDLVVHSLKKQPCWLDVTLVACVRDTVVKPCVES